MADSILNLILNIKKGGKGDKEAANGLEQFGKKVEKVVQSSKKNADTLKNTFGAASKLIGDAFKLAAEEAERLGRTEVTAQMKEMNDSFKSVADTLVQIPIGGRDFLAWMGDAAEGAANLGKTVSALAIFIGQQTGAIDDSTAAMQAALLVQGPVVLSTEQLAQAQKDLKDPLDETNRLNREYKTAAENAAIASANQAQKTYESQLAFEKLTGPVSDLNFAMGELTKQTIFNAAAAGLSGEAQLALAISMGLTNTKALEAKTRLDELRAQFNITDEAIANGTANVDGYSAAVARMGDQLEYAERQANALAIAAASALANGAGAAAGGGVVAGGSGGYATGGQFMVGGSGGTDSTPVSFMATPGERVTIETPAQQAANTTNNNSTASTVNNFYISSNDPRAVAQEVSRLMAAKTRAAIQSGQRNIR